VEPTIAGRVARVRGRASPHPPLATAAESPPIATDGGFLFCDDAIMAGSPCKPGAENAAPGGAMFLNWEQRVRPRRELNYSWYPIESAPFDEDVAVEVTDGRGAPYALRWPCRQTAAGWINSAKGTPLAVTPVRWRPYYPPPAQPQ
jgi:hypothetical protein